MATILNRLILPLQNSYQSSFYQGFASSCSGLPINSLYANKRCVVSFTENLIQFKL